MIPLPTRTLLILCLAFAFSTTLWSQNIFKVKVEGCNVSRFCLDCGSPKASYDETEFKKILAAVNSKYKFKGLHGKIYFQVLVDSAGIPCVLSHSDETKSNFTLELIQYLNQCHWVAAIDGGKQVSASENVVFTIEDGHLTGSLEKIDPPAMITNMKNPGTPVVYNKSYDYRNPSYSTYKITVWQKENSGLPQDMSQHSIVDKNDALWCATLNGMARFDGHKFSRLTESNSPFTGSQIADAIAVDQDNNKWFASMKQLYKYDDKQWTKCTPEQTGFDGGIYNIICTPYDEIFFCTEKGLGMLKNGHWEFVTDQQIKELPSNRINYAYRDKQRRLWIGTYGGSVMIDTNQQVTTFNQSETPLQQICITGVVEDEAGNLYFSLYDYIRSKERHRPKEGLAILSKDGNWLHLSDVNSGLPSNHINSLLFDRFEKVLWIGTNESGLVRYDLKNGWENYHNENSKVPSSYIFDLSQDAKGNIYASTYYGIMRISKK